MPSIILPHKANAFVLIFLYSCDVFVFVFVLWEHIWLECPFLCNGVFPLNSCKLFWIKLSGTWNHNVLMVNLCSKTKKPKKQRKKKWRKAEEKKEMRVKSQCSDAQRANKFICSLDRILMFLVRECKEFPLECGQRANTTQAQANWSYLNEFAQVDYTIEV